MIDVLVGIDECEVVHNSLNTKAFFDVFLQLELQEREYQAFTGSLRKMANY